MVVVQLEQKPKDVLDFKKSIKRIFHLTLSSWYVTTTPLLLHKLLLLLSVALDRGTRCVFDVRMFGADMNDGLKPSHLDIFHFLQCVMIYRIYMKLEMTGLLLTKKKSLLHETLAFKTDVIF